MSNVEERIEQLAQWISEAKYLVVFTGAGISTESGLPDFRGPDGIWTRRDKGLPPNPRPFSSAEPNLGHRALVDLQNLGKLHFLISQNVDNLHLKSGIRPDLLAELHGNITKLRCQRCQTQVDQSSRCDLFIVAGSSLVVSPANEMPRIALESGARLVIINKGETHLDKSCHLRFEENIGEVLPPVVERLREIIESS